MVNLRNLSVILALRIEGAKFSGVFDEDINYLSGTIVQDMNKHSDVYFEIIKFLVDQVMHGEHQDFWNDLPDFLIIDVCKIFFPDDLLKAIQEIIIKVEKQYYQDQQTGKLTEDVDLDLSAAFKNSDNDIRDIVYLLDDLSVEKIYPSIILLSFEDNEGDKLAFLGVIKFKIWHTYRGKLWVKKAFGDDNKGNIKQMYSMPKQRTFGNDQQKDKKLALLPLGDQINIERAERIDNIRNIFQSLDSAAKNSKGWSAVQNKKSILRRLANKRITKIEDEQWKKGSKKEGLDVELFDDYNPENQRIVLDIIDEIMLGSGEFAGMYFHFKKLNVSKNLSTVKDEPKSWQSNSRWISGINKGRVANGLTAFGMLFRSRAMIYAHVLSNFDKKSGNIPKAYSLVYKEISKHNSENESQGITYAGLQPFDFTNPKK